MLKLPSLKQKEKNIFLSDRTLVMILSIKKLLVVQVFNTFSFRFRVKKFTQKNINNCYYILIMDKSLEIKKYRQDKTVELIESYKDLIKKTFEVVDKDLLQEKIDDKVDAKQSEQNFLDAIKKRRSSLDEVDLMLDKIEKLEKVLTDEDDNGEAPSKKPSNRAKQFAAKKNDEK